MVKKKDEFFLLLRVAKVKFYRKKCRVRSKKAFLSKTRVGTKYEPMHGFGQGQNVVSTGENWKEQTSVNKVTFSKF